MDILCAVHVLSYFCSWWCALLMQDWFFLCMQWSNEILEDISKQQGEVTLWDVAQQNLKHLQGSWMGTLYTLFSSQLLGADAFKSCMCAMVVTLNVCGYSGSAPVATCTLHNVLSAVVLSSGKEPILPDFVDWVLCIVIWTLSWIQSIIAWIHLLSVTTNLAWHWTSLSLSAFSLLCSAVLSCIFFVLFGSSQDIYKRN